jgi:hypothetical protein
MHLAKLPVSRLFMALPGIRGFGLAVCLGGFIAGAGCAIADASGGEPTSGTILFDIPSESLTAALEAYARISGREVLYDGTLATGRRSSKVEGVYAPAAALRLLLSGTGLSAQFKDADFFVLAPTPRAEHQAGARARNRPAPQDLPSIITVEVVGYGGTSADDAPRDKNERRKTPNDRRRNDQSYDPTSTFRVIGNGDLTDEQKRKLTEEERSHL